MLTYFILYTIVILAYGASIEIKNPIKYFFFGISFLSVWLFSGLRGSVGQDTYNYTAHFDNINTPSDMLSYFGEVEPLFAAIVVFVKLFSDNVTVLFLVISFIQSALLFFISRRIHHKILFLSVYLLIFYAEFHMNVLRAGLAGLFFMAALVTSRNRTLSWILLIMAIFSHISILAFFPVYVMRLGLGLKLILKVLLGSILVISFYYYFYADELTLKLTAYFIDGVVDGSVPQVPVILSLLGFSIWLISKKLGKDITIVFIFFTIFWIGSTQIEILYRLVYLGLLIFFCLSLERRCWFRFNIRPIIVYSVVLGLWFTFINHLNMAGEFEKFKQNGKGQLEYTYIPYSSVISE